MYLCSREIRLPYIFSPSLGGLGLGLSWLTISAEKTQPLKFHACPTWHGGNVWLGTYRYEFPAIWPVWLWRGKSAAPLAASPVSGTATIESEQSELLRIRKKSLVLWENRQKKTLQQFRKHTKYIHEGFWPFHYHYMRWQISWHGTWQSQGLSWCDLHTIQNGNFNLGTSLNQQLELQTNLIHGTRYGT